MTEQQTPEPEDTTEDQRQDEGPDAAELDRDPAYEPDDEGLKDIKGG